MKRDQIQSDVVAYMKARDAQALTALRGLISQIKYREIDLGHSMSDDEVDVLIADTITSLSESLTKFQASGREDLCEEYKYQINLYQSYLPPAVDDATLTQLVAEIIADNSQIDPARKGQIIGIANQKLKTKASIQRISAETKKQLGM